MEKSYIRVLLLLVGWYETSLFSKQLWLIAFVMIEKFSANPPPSSTDWMQMHCLTKPAGQETSLIGGGITLTNRSGHVYNIRRFFHVGFAIRDLHLCVRPG